jgi:hypothetical protein
VSAALVAVQFADDSLDPIVFPQVPSRNNVIREFQSWLLPRKSKNQRTSYQAYMSLLTAVAAKSGLTSPEEVEMVLFANAETLASDVIKRQRKSASELMLNL